ncbi:MAG: cobalamin-dependent protein [Desulfobacterales bacterium]|nr:MAG: cobalamin-dependent protein [Desulfobacterales bacterium]
MEKLLGAKLAHCIGGLTSDPVKRAGWVFVLHEIHEHDSVGSMIYGDTISFSGEYSQNRGVVAEYLTWDIMAQLECPTGHAVLPLPVTEALRIPSADKIAEAQCFGRRIEESARRMWPRVDFSSVYDFSGKVFSAGKSVLNNALTCLKEAGVDIRDPVQMLYVLKVLGPSDFEEIFGAGEIDADFPRGRQPVVATDVCQLSQRYIQDYRHIFDNPKSRSILEGRKILIASTDVHEHAIMIIHELLSKAGTEMINLGAEVDPNQIAVEASTGEVEAILISTHNGMALEYAKRLKEELEKQNIKIPVVIGGILNQKVEDTALPIDVTSHLKKLDFYPCPKLENRFNRLLESKIKEKEKWL